jgi:N-acetylmuramoyl-L-alanine amidase
MSHAGRPHSARCIRSDDLAGLNLATMPKVLIECGNMNNAKDAALLVHPSVQFSIARSRQRSSVSLTGR